MGKRIAVVPGDGVGPEVAYCKETGQMMPDSGLEVLRGFDAIYLGAIGCGRRSPITSASGASRRTGPHRHPE